MDFIQRNYPRVPVQTPITVTIDNHVLKNAQCINISMGGMCVAVNDTIEEQQKGTVELEIEFENERINFKGEFTVQWISGKDLNSREKNFGLKFTYYDSANLTNLARIIVDLLRAGKNSA